MFAVPAVDVPRLEAGQRVVLLADASEATDQIDPTNCVLAHLDVATERLIVECTLTSDPLLAANTGDFVFAFVMQPGDAYYARAFRVENVQQPDAGAPRVLLVLRPSGRWQRVDRRRSERVALSSQFIEGRRFPATGGLVRFEASVRDISEGGLLLATEQHLQLRDVLEFELPLDRPLKARARVLHVQSAPSAEQHKWLAGCKFEGLATDDTARIGEYVASQMVPV